MSRWKIKRRRTSEQKRRERQERRDRPEKQKRPAAQSIRFGIGNSSPESPFRATISPVSPADIPVLARYFKAHRLLPRNYLFDPSEPKYRRIAAKAVVILRDPKAKKKEHTRAIVILGHSPSPLAVNALQELAQSNHPQADLARMALDECFDMMAQFPTSLADSGGSPRADSMN